MKVSGTSNTFLSIYVIGVIAFLSINLFFGFVYSQSSDEEGPYPMNLTITTSIGITISDILAEGILYTNDTGSVSNVQYPVNQGQDENATWDYVGGTELTWYNITSAGNTNIDVCGKAAKNLTCSPLTPGCGSDIILLANATWENATSASPGPSYPAESIWTGSYTTANLTAGSLAQSSTIYTRYWLSVPSGINSGIYNTTFTYCGVEAGQSCTC